MHGLRIDDDITHSMGRDSAVNFMQKCTSRETPNPKPKVDMSESRYELIVFFVFVFLAFVHNILSQRLFTFKGFRAVSLLKV
jgi:hypothetical protein